MKKILVLLPLGLLWAAFAFAQNAPATQDAPTTDQATPSANTSSGSTSVQGCLSESDGNYMLTQDGNGTTYKLAGDESQLKKHVGHEVAITGQSTSTTGSAAAGSDQPQAQSSSSDGTVLQVTDVKMISKQCTSTASDSKSQ
jgi:hypothetical protein